MTAADRDKLPLVALLVGLILAFSGGYSYLGDPYVGGGLGALLFTSLWVMLLR
jgi:hypothetical protein